MSQLSIFFLFGSKVIIITSFFYLFLYYLEWLCKMYYRLIKYFPYLFTFFHFPSLANPNSLCCLWSIFDIHKTSFVYIIFNVVRMVTIDNDNVFCLVSIEAMRFLKEKMKMLKNDLKIWNKRFFWDVNRKKIGDNWVD